MPFLTQQGINQIFEDETQTSLFGIYSSINDDKRHLKNKDFLLSQYDTYDIFHISRSRCKLAYQDYKSACSEVKNCESMSNEQDLHQLIEKNNNIKNFAKRCLFKRELYSLYCNFDEVDQGHKQQLDQTLNVYDKCNLIIEIIKNKIEKNSL